MTKITTTYELDSMINNLSIPRKYTITYNNQEINIYIGTKYKNNSSICRGKWIKNNKYEIHLTISPSSSKIDEIVKAIAYSELPLINNKYRLLSTKIYVNEQYYHKLKYWIPKSLIKNKPRNYGRHSVQMCQSCNK